MLCQSPWKGENRKQPIRHSHVHDEKVDSFSHGFHLVDNYSDERISNKGGNKNNAVNNGTSDIYYFHTIGTETVRRRVHINFIHSGLDTLFP